MEKVARTAIHGVLLALLAGPVVGAAAESAGPAGQTPGRDPSYQERVALLEGAYRRNPGDVETLSALVGSYAMAERYEKAIHVITVFLEREPGQDRWRFRLAQMYYWDGNVRSALEELDKTSSPLNPPEAQFRCHVLSSSGRAKEAASCYKTLIQAGDPEKRAAYELGLARNSAWSGATRQAINSYLKYLEEHSDDREVAIELARQLVYRGNYGEAEERLNALLALNPNDAEVLVLKSELLHWHGKRSFEAREDAERALQISPDDLGARLAHVYALQDLGQRRSAVREFDEIQRQLTSQKGRNLEASDAPGYRYLERNLERFSVSDSILPISIYNDSDSIHAVSAAIEVGIPVQHDHKIQLRVSERSSSAPEGSVFTLDREKARLRQFEVGGTLLARPGMSLKLLGGAADRPRGDGLRPIFQVRLGGSPTDRWETQFDAGREFLALTPRALDLDISNYFVAGAVRYHFDSRSSLGISGNRRLWSDDNASTLLQTDYSRTLRHSSKFLIDAGVRSRIESFDRDTELASGFFTPDLLWRHEATLGFNGALGHRFRYDIRGAAGTQRMKRGASYRFSYELFSSLRFSLGGPFSLTANYLRRNYSLTTFDGWYQGFYFALQIQR